MAVNFPTPKPMKPIFDWAQPPTIPGTSYPGTAQGPTPVSGNSPQLPNGLQNFLGSLDAKDKIALAGMGLDTIGGAFSAHSANQQFQQTSQQARQQFVANLLLSQLQNNEGIQSDANTADQARRGLALSATQMDPFAQQKSLYGMGVRGAEAHAGPAHLDPNTGQLLGQADLSGAADSYLSPDALQGALTNFDEARLTATGGQGPTNDYSSIGLPGGNGADLSAYAQGQKAHVQEGIDAQKTLSNDTFNNPLIQQLLQEGGALPGTGPGGAPPEGYEYDKKTGQLKKKGSSFLHKLGSIASFAAPIIAAPFTGGTSLALLGAGAGAAGGALAGGGLKGALLGGAMGAIPGLGGGANNAVAPTIGAGLKQAGKSAVKNPALYSALLGGH